MGQSYQVRPCSHDQAADGNQPRTMELCAEIADKGYDQQITCNHNHNDNDNDNKSMKRLLDKIR